MKLILFFYHLVFLSNTFIRNTAIAQDCKATTFTQLSDIQKSKLEDKEDLILNSGYSFEREEVREGYTFRYYGKCNIPNLGYKERISFNVTQNSIGYGTYTKEQYLSIKKRVSSTFKCARKQSNGFDIFENCSDGRAYLFIVSDVKGRGYYYVDIQH